MQDSLIKLFDALTEAANWELHMLDTEKTECTYNEARRKVVERIFAKYKDEFDFAQPHTAEHEPSVHDFMNDLCERIKTEFMPS